MSYDGKWLHFQGSCYYTTSRDGCENGVPVKSPTWEVIQNNDGSGVSYVRQAEVHLYEYDLEIGLYNGLVTVNNVRVPGSPMSYADGKVRITLGSQIIVTVKGSIQVKFANSYIEVNVLTPMREKVCGLCGNFDGDTSNDWTIGKSHYCMTKYPNAVPGQVTGDLNIMGTSWTAKMDKVESTCVTQCPNPPPPTGCDVDSGFKAEDHCDILRSTSGPFKTCLASMSELQRDEIFDNCVYDACNLNNYEDIVCRHAASVAKVCTDQYDLKITWRSTSFCPMKCEGENTEYQACGDPCFPSCSDREGANCGDLGPCTEGCFCKKGFVFDGTKDCIPTSSCGCEVKAIGVYINVGDSYKASDCSASCTCEEAGADLVCEDMTCGENYVCGTKNQEPACICEPPFIEKDGECIELPYPCEEDEQLQCFTCDTFSDDDCVEFGRLEFCTDDEPICTYHVTRDASSEVTKVVRGCGKKADCVADSIGLGIEFCEDMVGGSSECSRCNYGDTNEDDEGDIATADCGIPPVPTTPAPADPCSMKLDTGSGGKNEVRYYFDAATKLCIKFKYGGSGGNENNFSDKSQCEAACGFQPPDICKLPADKGDGDGKMVKRFTYDAKKRKCKKFKYTGSGGNENNFPNKKQCKKACMG
jgi:hypothetical protein